MTTDNTAAISLDTVKSIPAPATDVGCAPAVSAQVPGANPADDLARATVAALASFRAELKYGIRQLEAEMIRRVQSEVHILRRTTAAALDSLEADLIGFQQGKPAQDLGARSGRGFTAPVRSRRPKTWAKSTVPGRVLKALQTRGALHITNVLDVVSNDGLGEVPYGSITAALSTLKKYGMAETDNGTWQLIEEGDPGDAAAGGATGSGADT